LRYLQQPNQHPNSQKARRAEESDKKTRGTDSSATRAPGERAAKSLLGLRFIPILRFPPGVLILGLHSPTSARHLALERGLKALSEELHASCKLRSGRMRSSSRSPAGMGAALLALAEAPARGKPSPCLPSD